MATKPDSDTAKSSSTSFYTLTPGWATKYCFAKVDTSSMGDASVEWSYRRLADFKGTAFLEVESGTTCGDFLRNDALLMVVTSRLITILKSHGIRAFSTYRVRVTRDGVDIPGYFGLAVLGKGGPNDPSLVTYCEDARSKSKSRKIDGLRPTKWDGSDLFTLDDMYRVVLATEKVRRVFKQERVTNCLFEPAEEFKIGY